MLPVHLLPAFAARSERHRHPLCRPRITEQSQDRSRALVGEFGRHSRRSCGEKLQGQHGPGAVSIPPLQVQTGGAGGCAGNDQRADDDARPADDDRQVSAVGAQVRGRSARVQDVPGEENDDVGPRRLRPWAVVFAGVGLLGDDEPVGGGFEPHTHGHGEGVLRPSARDFEDDAAGGVRPIEVDAAQGIAQPG
ncbi:MAG TPA: hypothetical protein DCR63_07850, partial [Microbacterium sp.]|nr:hypothetical protein [Microbacterium sp.]